jgi:archaellum biogenesis ATPase FlaH
MSINEETNKKKDIEKKIIFLLLKHKLLIENFIREGLSQDFFCEEHKFIVLSILDVFSANNVLLTFGTFYDKIQTMRIPKDRVEQEFIYSSCASAYVEIDDFPLLIDKLYEEFLKSTLDNSLSNLNNNIRKKPTIETIKSLMSDLENVVSRVKLRKKCGESYFDDIDNLSKEMIERLEGIKDGTITEDPLILTGIDEVDETMMTGLEEGTLTLFTADVGGGKSSVILNIGLNVWKSGHNVLFVPLEMSRKQMWIKACARDAKINSRLFYKPKDLTEEQLEKIKKVKESWSKYPAKFFIMQEPGRITIRKIQETIENHIDIFHPRLVIIDYVANLEADKDRYGRNDLEIGDMLKEMREMGKTMGFAVISAAQLGREALKRIRKSGAMKEKAQVNSEDIQGSHQYSADADNIYAMLEHPHEPRSKIDLFVVKARNGKKTFESGSVRATLSYQPEHSYIYTDHYGEADAMKPDDHEFDFISKKDEDPDKKIEDLIKQQEEEERNKRVNNKEFADEEEISEIIKKEENILSDENSPDDVEWDA